MVNDAFCTPLQGKPSMFITHKSNSIIRLALFAFLLTNSQFNFAEMRNYQTSAFTAGDYQYIERAKSLLDSTLRREYGATLRLEKTYLFPLMQKLIDSGVANKNETALLQAIGIGLGEIMIKELNMEWIRYSDNQGVSRALRLKHEEFYFFPITQISRRVSGGAEADIDVIYDRSADKVKTYYEIQRDDF